MKKIVLIGLVFLMTLTFTACGSKEKVITKTEKGFGGDVVVKVTFDDKTITKVEVTGDKETADIGTKAIEELPKAIVKANSADVDVVSGATVTSDAILNAVKAAIEENK